nr:MAG TPA: hypothetical protein [Caudoviricetes sp.]
MLASLYFLLALFRNRHYVKSHVIRDEPALHLTLTISRFPTIWSAN